MWAPRPNGLCTKKNLATKRPVPKYSWPQNNTKGSNPKNIPGHKKMFGPERPQTQKKTSPQNVPFLFRNAKCFLAPVQGNPTLSSWLKEPKNP